MKPICRRDFRPLHPLPQVAPLEIEEVTFQEVDLPAKFLVRLESDAQQIRQKFEVLSVDDYAVATGQILTEENRLELQEELRSHQRMTLDEAKFQWFGIEAAMAFTNTKNERQSAGDDDVSIVFT